MKNSVEKTLSLAKEMNMRNRCAGAFAKDSNSRSVRVNSPVATKWCMLGAISAWAPDSETFERVLDVIDATKPKRFKRVVNIADIHDRLSYRELNDWWDKAISLARTRSNEKRS